MPDLHPPQVTYKLAKLISVLGHPLLTLAAFTLLISFRMYNASTAIVISVLMIGFLVVPVTIRNYVKFRRGEYTNFDVSDQTQRHSFYKFGIALLACVTVALYFIPGTKEFFIGTLCALAMVLVSGIVNFRIKTSLHTGVSMFISIIYFQLDFTVACVLLVFTALIAMSRLLLKRHTWIEVIMGALIGVMFGLTNNYVQANLS